MNPHPLQQIVIGLGTGRCGTLTLATLLNLQPNSDVSHERRPLLPWSADDREPIVRCRLAGLKRGNASLVGDVAMFYLPYVKELLRQEPSIRFVVLRRDRDEVVRSFSNWCDTAHRIRIDNWSETPNPGFYQHPLWSTSFPKFKAENREDALAKYWNDYYEVADQFQRDHPDRLKIFDMKTTFGTQEGQRELLSFVGLPRDRQVIDTSLHLHQAIPSAGHQTHSDDVDNDNSNNRCVILVPFQPSISPACRSTLKSLEERGYIVRRVESDSSEDCGRNEIATDAMLDGFDETLWIDPDIGFDPDAVDRIRSHGLPIVGGVYPKIGCRELAIEVLPDTRQIRCGRGGGLEEIRFAGMGFLYAQRQVYDDIQRHFRLPICNEFSGRAVIPYFLPMIANEHEGHRYLDAGQAFCERARIAGHNIMADTTIRLWRFGSYAYSWEDAGNDVTRFDDFTFVFADS